MLRRGLFFSLLLLTVAPTVSAQWGSEVRNVYFDTIRGGAEPTPIGVDEMRYVGVQYITRDDSIVMSYTTRVIQNDLNFHTDFDLVPLDSFYLRTYEILELDALGWKRLGAERLVKLEAEFPGNMIRVTWRLFDTNRQTQIYRDVTEHPKSDWRTLGHEIANEVVRVLTGDPGIFLTKIVYAKKSGDAKEIYMADYDGANEVQLTTTGTINISPAWHPILPEVYFVSYRDGPPSLFRVNVNSKEMKKVATFPGIVAAPAIHPKGDRLACVLSKDGNSEIYVLDINGNVIKRLTRDGSIDTSPTWSPDGRMLAFSSDRTGSPQVYIMDSDGLNTRRLTFQGGYNDSPIWSSRADRITFVSRTKQGRFDLASIDTSGFDYRILTQVGMNENPHFAPDGKHIIFASSRLGPSDVYTMDVSGRNQRRLTRGGNCSNPAWGPLR